VLFLLEYDAHDVSMLCLLTQYVTYFPGEFRFLGILSHDISSGLYWVEYPIFFTKSDRPMADCLPALSNVPPGKPAEMLSPCLHSLLDEMMVISTLNFLSSRTL
jgi:hypothetical protein